MNGSDLGMQVGSLAEPFLPATKKLSGEGVV